MPTRALSSRWIAKRKEHWARLEELLGRGRGGVGALAHNEVRELALLYRQTAADLSAAREDAANAQLAAYLNQLLGRAHNLVYGGRPARPRSVIAFYARTFPQTFRDAWGYSAAATALFVAGGLAGTAMSLADPDFPRFVLGGPMMDTIDRRQMWTHSIVAMKPLASSAILTNNLAVAFTAFASGALAGVGTVYMMVFNGLLMGVIGTSCYRAGMSGPLWSFVAPHGALELPAIFIAGGAGLLLARGVIAPGVLSRRDAIAESGAASIRLLLGVFPLLIIAGLVEGFLSPAPIAPAVKFAIGASLLVLLTLYLTAVKPAR
jgi:uncharacterized membrane protein SpoIIM required for sporulation